MPSNAADVPPTPVAYAQRLPTRPLRWMHVVAIVMGVSAVWGPVLVALVQGPESGRVIDRGMLASGLVRLVITFCVCSVIAALIDRATRRRSRWPGVAAFAVFSGLLGLLIVSALRDARHTAQLQALTKAAESEIDLLALLCREAGPADEFHREIGRSNARIRARAKGLSPHEVAITLIEFDATTEMMDKTRGFLQTVAACRGQGGPISEIRSADELDRRLALFRAARDEHARLMAFLREAPAATSDKFKEAGVSLRDPRVLHLMETMSPESKTVRSAQADDDMLRAQVKSLEILRDAWGEWTVQGSDVVFEGPKKAERAAAFLESQERAQAALRRQQDLDRK